MGLYIVGEGQSEMESLPTLVRKLANHLDLELPHTPKARAWRVLLHNEDAIVRVCQQLRGTAKAALFTKDADDEADCPKFRGPQMAAWVRSLELDFPVAVVLFRREYETMFLASVPSLVGQQLRGPGGIDRPGISAGSVFHGDPESPRNAKRWLDDNMPVGVAYKETLDQPAMTKLLDFNNPALRNLSSFRRLENGLRFLSENLGVVGAVYPGIPL